MPALQSLRDKDDLYIVPIELQRGLIGGREVVPARSLMSYRPCKCGDHAEKKYSLFSGLSIYDKDMYYDLVSRSIKFMFTFSGIFFMHFHWDGGGP